MAKNIKGRKFVATAASAALVASAIVPVASAAGFADQSKISSWAADAVAHAVEKGYMKGSNGSFNPQGTITKAEVAQVIFNALDLAPVTGGSFTDVPADAWFAGAVNAVAAKGIVSGTGAGTFEPNKAVTLAEAANMVVKALGLKGEADLSKFADASSVPTWANTAIQALVANGYIEGASNNGVLTLGALDNLSRERFAKFFVATAVDTIEDKKEAASAIKDFTAVGAKKLEVTFDGTVDKSKVKFEVKKGSVKVNVDSIDFNDKNTVATITLSGKITEGEYTVTVSDLTEKELSKTVKTENERVESVAIPSTEAPIITGTTGDRSVKVAYVVNNQYGENVTRSLGNITINASGAGIGAATASAGVVTVPLTLATTTIGSQFVLTVVETTTGKNASETIKIVAPSVPSAIEFTGVYNKDKKELSELSNVNRDNFYVLVDVKDQYGNKLTAAQLNNSIIINNANPTVATVDLAVTSSNSVAVFHTVTIDGVDRTALKVTNVLKAGTTDVMLVAGATGSHATYKLSIAEGQRAQTFEFVSPELFVAGEKTFVPIRVYDKTGEEIKNIDLINDSVRGVKITYGNSTLTPYVKNGVIGVDVTTAAGDYNATLNATVLSTFIPVFKTFSLLPAAKPVRVEGLTANSTTALLSTRNDDQAISLSTVVLYDQYERVIPTASKTALFASAYELVVSEASTAATSAVTLTGSNNSYKVTAQAKGTERITIAIKDKTTGATVSGSEKVVTFTTTDGQEYVSYELEEIGLVADNSIHKDNAGSELLTAAAYKQAVIVYGVLSNGAKVELDAADYTVKFSDNDVSVDGSGIITVANAATSADSAKINYDANGDGKVSVTELTATVKLNVTIQATGTQLAQDVTISRAGAAPAKAVAVAKGSVTGTPGSIIGAGIAAQATPLTQIVTTSASVSIGNEVDYLVTDQYGVITLQGATVATYLATPEVAYSVTVTGQTQNNLSISQIDAGDSVSVTATFAPGVTYKFTVVGK